MARLTNQNGTDSADELFYYTEGTYHAGGGNDTINIKGGTGNDFIKVEKGANNTLYGGEGTNVYHVRGGSKKRFVGGDSKPYSGFGDTFYVYAEAQSYNLLYGNQGEDYYSVNYEAKVAIDVDRNHGNDTDCFNLVGAVLKDCDIVVDKDNSILKLNDIYIKGTSVIFREGASQLGVQGSQVVKVSDIYNVSTLGKSYTQKSLLTEYNNVIYNMGSIGKTVALEDISSGLELTSKGIMETLSAIIAENTVG